MERPEIWGIDGDILLYEVGFAAQDDPIEFARHSLRQRVQGVMDGCECKKAQLFLTGDTNFRNELSDTYKANRKGADKPVHIDALKEFAIESLDAIVSENEEADDLLGIHAVQDGWGIATLDKDLDGVPGWHYVWKGKREGLYEVTPVEADRFFYTQMLTGDSTDNIPGLFKMVGVKALAKTKAPIQDMTDPLEMYQYVRSVYAEGYENVGMCMDDMDSVLDDWLTRIGGQLWIRREPGEVYATPS